MASSQVEVASSSTFGCVLRDRNHGDACRESNVKGTHHATFQRNIKNFVIDLNTCMAVSSDSTTNENNNNNISNEKKDPKNNNLERLRPSLISPRHSKLLDRWATKQAREMVSNLENEVDLLSMDDNETLPRTSSSTSDESSSEISNLGASSLVRMWEKRLNQSGVSKSNTPGDKVGSASSSPNSTNENENVNANVFSVEEQCLDGPSNEEILAFPDWGESSDHTVSPNSTSERDRVSVADLIKKLNSTHENDENEHEGYASSSVASSPCRERECGQQQHLEVNMRVTYALRIRGRQAFNNLLMQMENDRHGELNKLAQRGAVSKFAQRGRIQALLRLKLLQREAAAANDLSRQKSTASEVSNRQPQGSAIMQLREKFSSGAELRTSVQAEVANSRIPRKDIANNTKQSDNSATTNQLSKDTSNQTANGTSKNVTKSKKKSVSQTRTYNTEEAHPSSDVMVHETQPSSDVMVHETQPSSDVKAPHNDTQETTSKIDSNLNKTTDRAETSDQQNAMAKSSNDEKVKEEDASNQQHAETSYKETVEEEASNQNYAESNYDDEMLEEVEEIDQNCDETNLDWISEISRPRSYWEERRQAWYREMLEIGSQNEDIRKLLERRTVSSFLTGDFREKMDRLMESHKGTQTYLVNSQDHEEDSQGLMAFLQERLHSTRAAEEDEGDMGDEEGERRDQDEEEEEEEEENEDEQEHEHERESLISGSCHDAGDYSNRSSPWSYRDNEAGYDYSTSPQPYQSQPFYQDNRRSPSTNRHAIEMELMYDLRGQMEQLYHEIAELRKTIKGCVDMQMQLQQSINQQVHTDKKEEKKSHNKVLKKGNCCICYEKKVDALLYRCGHMCACHKCAIELQWNREKCPICQAKIVDVVRVYVED